MKINEKFPNFIAMSFEDKWLSWSELIEWVELVSTTTDFSNIILQTELENLEQLI